MNNAMLTCVEKRADSTGTVPATLKPLIVMYANGIEMIPSGLTAWELVDDGPRWLNHAVPEVRRYIGIVRDLMLAGF